MIDVLRKQAQKDDEGFTLIELMVVVLIIAILIAIAIPTFLGAQDRARDRAAQSDLRNALTAAKTIATDFEGLFKSPANSANELDANDLAAVEGALSFEAGVPSDTDHVGFDVVQDTDIGIPMSGLSLVRESSSGKWFALYANSKGEVLYGKSDSEITPAEACCTLSKW